jgi:acyl carrier protein
MSLGRLTDIFRSVFKQPDLILKPELTARDVEGWTSLAQLNLVVEIEAEFGVVLEIEEIAEIEDIGGIVSAMQAKGCDLSW